MSTIVSHEERAATAPALEAPVRASRAARWAAIASLVTSVVFIARSAFTLDGRLTFTLFDDAMISMSYARNLARGSGLVWNQGDVAVEGYTNFLWTGWMAVVHAVGTPIGLTSLAVMLTGAALLAGTVVLTARITREGESVPVAADIAAWMTALSPPLVYWTLRGMEVGLLAFLLVAAVALALRPGWRWQAPLLAILLACGILTRTDFAPSALVVGAFAVVWSSAEHRRRTAVLSFGAVAVTLLAHTAFRIAVYGSATPNTYALKVEGVPLTERVERGLAVLLDVVGIELLVPLAVVALGFLVDRRKPGRVEAVASVLVLTAFAYVAWTGGDAWEWMTMPNRYIAPVLPMLAALVGIAAVKVARAATPRTTVLAVAIGGVLVLVVAVAHPLVDDDRQLAAGKFLRLGALAAIAGLVVLAVWLRAPSRRPDRCAVGIGTIVVLALVAMPAWWWVRDNAAYLDADRHMARYGAALARVTTPETTIAVVLAGSIVYFADRPAVDLLGKSDPHIAHGDPVRHGFVPGHVKYDHAWSLGRLRPDLVTGMYGERRAAERALATYGYERVLDDVYVRAGATNVDVQALREHLREEPAGIVPAAFR